MIGSNLRHLRVFLAVAECGSITRAAERSFVSQPAVTQAIAKLEDLAAMPLFQRSPQGFFLTEAGRCLQARVRRALTLLDTALSEVSARLPLTATRPQLQALVAACEAQNFSLAARRLGIAQPTVHRAITQLEREADRPLFQRSPWGIAPTRPCAAIARAAQLAFVELEQARAELGELQGHEVGQIVIGALPLSRSHVLPRALSAFRRLRTHLPILVHDGTYDEMLGGLRRGEIDFMIGALRDPVPIEDVVQEPIFDDTLVLLAGRDHPLRAAPPTIEALAACPWLVPRTGTPTREQFDAMFDRAGVARPVSVIETGSVILMRELIQDGHHLACVSRLQALTEITRGLVHPLPWQLEGARRPIGLTYRRDWSPTQSQRLLLDLVRATEA